MDIPERLLAGGPWPGVTLVQVTAVALLGATAWAVARRGGPALRGAVILAALVGLLVVPAVAVVAPVWFPLPGVVHPVAARAVVPRPVEVALAPPPQAPSFVVPVVPPAEPPEKKFPGPDDLIDPFEQPDMPAEDTEPTTAVAPIPVRVTPPAEAAAEPRRADVSTASILVSIWLLGAVACLARSLVGLALLYWRAWRAEPIAEEDLPAGSGSAAVRESRAVDSPLTLGLFRPVILLPAGWRGWSDSQLTMVLAHESAHVRRRDFLAGLAAELAVCLFWFHPLVRWLAGRLRLEQEYAADAWAASAAGDAMAYVRCLARLALEGGAGRGSPAPALWRRRPEILRRIDMLRCNRGEHPRRLGRGMAGAVVGLAAAACVAVAGVGAGALRATADEPEPAEVAAGEVAAVAAVEAAPVAPIAADRYGDPLPDGAVGRLGTTRWRHGSPISFVAFGPGDQTLVTAGQDGTVRLWELATGKEIRRFALPKAPTPVPPAIRPPGAPAVVLPPLTPAVTVLPPLAPAATPATPVRNVVTGVGAAAAQADEAKARLEALKSQLEVMKALLEKPQPDKAQLEALKARYEAARAQLEKAQADAARVQLEAARAQAAAAAQIVPPATAGSGSGPVVALTPDGKTLAVANGAAVQLYDVDSGAERRKIDAPAAVTGMLFSPDGQTLAARGADGGYTLWAADTAKERTRIKPPARPNTAGNQVAAFRVGGADAPGMAFSPDSATLAVTATTYKGETPTGSVKLWDIATGKETLDIPAPQNGTTVGAVAFSPTGKVLAFAVNNVIHLCNAETGQERYQFRAPDIAASMVFSPDGKQLAVRGRGQQVRVWDAATGKELFVLGTPVQPQATGLAGAQVVFAGPITPAPEVRNLAFSQDGQRIAAAAGGTVRVWAATTGKEIPLTDGHQSPLAAVVLSPDGKTAVSWGTDRMIQRWDVATGKILNGFVLPTGAVALTPDGRIVAFSGPDGTIRLRDTATGKDTLSLKGHPRGASSLAFSPDGKLLAENAADGSIRLHDPAKGGEPRVFNPTPTNNPALAGNVVVVAPGRPPGGAGAGIVFSPDGTLIAAPGPTAAPGGRPAINLIDVGTGKVLRKIEPALPVVSHAFSPDGRVLATENADESVSLWEVASGRERARLGKPPAAAPAAPGAAPVLVRTVGGIGGTATPSGPTTLAFSPDGKAIATRGPDRSVRLWDVAGGKEVGQFKGHDGRVETVSFSADGKSFASGSADTTVLLWDATAALKDVAGVPAADLPAGGVEPLWTDLAGEDAGTALKAVLKLIGDPKQAVPFLAGHLKPAAAIDPQLLERWVADLESDKFTVRQEATTNLVKAGGQALPPLQKILAGQPTIETRLRVEGLIDRLTNGTLSTEQLRCVRGVEALERIGTPEARELLRALAAGAAGALPTREAKAALDRLTGR